MPRREHKGGAAATTLSSGILSSSTAFSVVDGSGYPTGVIGPFYVSLGEGATVEKVLCASRTGNNFTVSGGAAGRGVDDTLAVDHAAGVKVQHVLAAVEVDEHNAHVNATTAVHGITGDVVGRTDAQTLTNKSISGAANTLSAIPQSAVTSLVADLAAKLAVAAVHDTWEAIIAAAPGMNWQAALAAPLDAEAAAVLGAMGTGWPGILAVPPGSNWATALAALLAGDWPNILDSPINGGWLNVFAVDPASLRPVSTEDGANHSVSSATFAAGSPNCGVAFTAPPSGIAEIIVGGDIHTSQNTHGISLGWELRTGAIVGSGTVVTAASTLRALYAGNAVNSGAPAKTLASFYHPQSGLTAGNSYNVRTMHAVTSGGAGTVSHRYITARPVL